MITYTHVIVQVNASLSMPLNKKVPMLLKEWL